jgi:fatty acid desaturase
MYVKTLILLVSFVSLYGLLVFVAQQWWQSLPLAILLGLVTAAIGFNIQHDGGHQAYSSSSWVNRLMAMTLDLIGGSSYNWHWKHIMFHHFQVEHHIFPKICHVNYPIMSKLVEETCQEFGLNYMQHQSLWAGIVSHFRWLRQMSIPNTR